jgi:CheY-like chemotaxis protein
MPGILMSVIKMVMRPSSASRSTRPDPCPRSRRRGPGPPASRRSPRRHATLGPPQRVEEPPAGDYVMIAVGDTGTGMPPAMLAKCFEPFFTTKDIGKGSGLGLSQVLGFAQQSGGGVRVDTRAGEGTTVRVYLPRATVQSQAQVGGELSPPSAEPVNGARKILLVDDDHGVREITSSMLQEMGHDVLEAGSGGHALELLDRQPRIDLMLIDFAMPGMNGAELARHARAKRPSLPMIFLTGYADTTALRGIDQEHVLRKPFRDSDLIAKIRSVLESEPAADSEQPPASQAGAHAGSA